MKKLINILRMTIVGGVFFLAPFVVLIIILAKAHNIIGAAITPLAENIPIESVAGFETPTVLAVLAIVFMCFLAGLFSKTMPAKKLVDWLETSLLSNIPGYSFLKNLGEEAAGVTPTHGYEAVLARFDDAWQIGFLVERIAGGHVVVYIPGAPSPWTGSVFIFDEDRVEPLGVASPAAIKCLQKLGEGAGDMVKRRL